MPAPKGTSNRYYTTISEKEKSDWPCHPSYVSVGARRLRHDWLWIFVHGLRIFPKCNRPILEVEKRLIIHYRSVTNHLHTNHHCACISYVHYHQPSAEVASLIGAQATTSRSSFLFRLIWILQQSCTSRLGRIHAQKLTNTYRFYNFAALQMRRLRGTLAQLV